MQQQITIAQTLLQATQLLGQLCFFIMMVIMSFIFNSDS